MGNCSGAGNQESVVYLLQKGDNEKVIKSFIEFQDVFKAGYSVNSFGDTALHYAAALGNIEIVKWLCAHGAEVNAENNNGWTPGDSAAFNSKSEVVGFLKTAGGKLNYFSKNSTDETH